MRPNITSLLLIYCLLGLTSANAQQPLVQTFGSIGHIYRLDPPQALALVRCKRLPQPQQQRCGAWEQAAQTLLGKTPWTVFDRRYPSNLSTALKALPSGCYAVVQAIEENLQLEVYCASSLSVYPRFYAKGLELVVYDSLGAPVEDARIWLDGKQLRFSPRSSTYILRKRHKGGLLRVEARGELCLLELEETLNTFYTFGKRHRRYLTQRLLGAKTYNTLRLWQQLVQNAPFALFSERHRGNIDNLWHLKARHRAIRKALCGYVVLNQPRYLPGDTLRAKAYVANRKGRPRKHPLRFLVEGQGQQRFTQIVSPKKAGHFEVEMVLKDSLRLDQSYAAVFQSPRKLPRCLRDYYDPSDVHWQLEADFKYEDYQLDIVQYHLKVGPSGYYNHQDTVWLELQAVDANQQPVPAGRAQLWASATQVDPIADTLWVADTLWQTALPLRDDGTTLVPIPPNVLPKGNLNVQITAQFTNNAGEIQRQSQNLRWQPYPTDLAPPHAAGTALISNNRPQLALWQEGDFLKASRYPIAPDSAKLTLWFRGGQQKTSIIPLPSSVPLPKSVWMAKITAGTSEAVYVREIRMPELSLVALGDTLLCRLENSAKLPVYYIFSRGGTPLRKGILRDTVLAWREFGATRFDYSLCCYAIGTLEKETQRCVAHNSRKPDLTVSLEPPEQVRPGDRAWVRVKVRDRQDRPVQHVQVAALAINTQFGGATPFSAPQIVKKGAPLSPFQYARFAITGSSNRDFRSSIPTPKAGWPGTEECETPCFRACIPIPKAVSGAPSWYHRLALDTLLYYRLRFAPDASKAFVHLWEYPSIDSADYRRPQFSPFIVHEGRSEPIHAIFCNQRLVYSSTATTPQPYSFYGDKGPNEIKVRTRNAQYTIRSLEMNYGQKWELAIEDRPKIPRWYVETTHGNLEVLRQPMPDTLTIQEQKQLLDAMLLWKPLPDQKGTHYLWQGKHRVFQWTNKGTGLQIIGPFAPDDGPIAFVKHGDYFTKFRFDAGFAHEIMPQRERLYDNHRWPSKRGKLSHSLPQLPGGLATPLQVVDFTKDNKVKTLKIRQFMSPSSDKPDMGSLNLRLKLPRDSALGAIVLRHKAERNWPQDTMIGPFNGQTRRLDGLRPGVYQLLLFTPGGYRMEKDLCIRRNGTLYVVLDTLIFHAPKPKETLGNLFSLDTIEVTYKSTQKSRFSPSRQGIGSATLKVTVVGDGEALIGATVIIQQSGVMVYGAVTDVEGHLEVVLPSGVYDLECRYTGYHTHQIAGVALHNGRIEVVDIEMTASESLQEVVVTGLGASSISYDLAIAGKLSGVSIIPFDEPTTLPIPEWAGETVPPPVPKVRQRFRDWAYWQPQLVTDKHGEADFQVRFPDNITSWTGYALGMDRKNRAGIGMARTHSFLPLSAQLSLPRFAVAGDIFEAAGLTTHLDRDSVDVETAFFQSDSLLRRRVTRIGRGLAEYTPVSVPAGADSLRLRYEIRAPQASDAEERHIAILPVGTEAVNGVCWAIERDTEWVYQPEPGKGPVLVEVFHAPLDLLIEDVKYLANYPFGCNEQTSSRLIALLLSRKIALKVPSAAIPKVETEIARCLKRLDSNQWPNGTWGWWKNDSYDAWMTIYVLKALCMAQQEGFDSKALPTGLAWLRAHLGDLQPSDLAQGLLLLRECGVNVDCQAYWQKIAEKAPKSLHERLVRLRIQQLCDMPIAIDSLRQYLTGHATGGYYCGERLCDWHSNRATNTLLAYDIAQTAQWESITAGIRRYWWRSRGVVARNTIETTQVLLRLLPHTDQPIATQSPLWINGASIPDTTTRLILPDAPLHFKVGEGRHLYLSATQRWFNPVPIPLDSHFTVRTSLWQGNPAQKNQPLQRGQPARLEVSLHSPTAADYIMLEVPLPAGCTYDEKQQRYDRFVTHTEYFRDRVVLFFRTLPSGEHRFDIPLQPRFSGHFTLNPARAEQMYFPTLYGHNGIGKVRVE